MIEEIEKSEVFAQYKQAHPKAYLAHVFSMRKAGNRDEQVGYYNPASGKVTTFTNNPVRIENEDEPASKEDHVKELDYTKVSVNVEQALAAANELVSKEYSSQVVTQEICVLQHLDAQLWNMTLVTSAFNMINVRVDASSGEVIKHEQHSLLSLGKQV